MKLFVNSATVFLLLFSVSTLCSAQEQNANNYKEGLKNYQLENFRAAVPDLEQYINANITGKGLVLGAKVDYAFQIAAASSFYSCDFVKSESLSKKLLQRASYSDVLLYGCYYNLGQLAYFQNDLSQALEYLNKAVAATRKNGDALLLRGVCHLEMGNPQAAEMDFNEVLKNKNTDLLRAKAIYYKGDKTNGLSQLLSAVKSDPTVFNYYHLASLSAREGDKEATLRHLETAFAKGLRHYPVYVFFERNFDEIRKSDEFKTMIDKQGLKDIYSKPVLPVVEMKEEAPVPQTTQLPPPTVKEVPNDTTAVLVSRADGYSSKIWLLPSNLLPEHNLEKFGLATFHPVTAWQLTEQSDQTLLNIPPSAFIRSVKEDQLFTSDYVTTGLQLSAIPEFRDLFASLKGQDELIIASKRDSVISALIALKKRYADANNRFVNTEYEISGTCTAYKNDYDVNSEEINLHVSLDYEGKQAAHIYVATVRTPLPLNEAIRFFDKNENYQTTVKFRILPGLTRKGLGISGGGVSAWSVPNLVVVQNPVFHFENPNGFAFEVMAPDLKGLVWPDHVKVGRWDLHRFNKPDKQNIRVINGTRMK